MNFAGRTARLLSHPATAFGPIASVLKAAGLTAVNLETAVTSRGRPQPKTYHFRTTPLAFTARAATRPAGLYRAKVQAGSQTFAAGWVLLPGGEQRGVVRNGVTLMPAPVLDGTSDRVKIAGRTVTAMRVDESNH